MAPPPECFPRGLSTVSLKQNGLKKIGISCGLQEMTEVLRTSLLLETGSVRYLCCPRS